MRGVLGRLSATIAAFVLTCTSALANEVIVYTYDELGRLIGVSTTGTVNGGQDVVTNLDPAGNRKSYSVNGVPVRMLTIANSSNGNEAGGNGLLTVSQSLISVSATTVNLIYGGTATGGGTDYSGPSSVTIPAGQTSATVTLVVVNDNIVDGDETVTVTLGSVTAGTATVGTPASATNTIADNDVAPTLAISAASVAEGGALSFTVTRSGLTSGTSSASYSTSNGTAAAGNDFTAGTGTVTFTANQATATITVNTLTDALVEASETMTVTLAGPVGASISNAVGTGSILDNTSTIGLGFAAANEGGVLTFYVGRTGGTSGSASVTYATSDLTAIAGSDYTAKTGTLVFGPGQTSATVTINALADTVTPEAAETFRVILSSPSPGTSVTNLKGKGTIYAN